MSCLISLRIPRDERASERQSVLVLSSCERTRKEEFPLVSSLRSQTCELPFQSWILFCVLAE